MGLVLKQSAPDPDPQQQPFDPYAGFQVPPEELQAMQAIRDRANQAPAPRYTPDQIAQRTSDNQRQYALGMLGMLSGNEDLQNVGATFFKQALADRQPHITEHGSYDNLTGQFTYDPDYLQQRADDQSNQALARIGAQRQAWAQARTQAQERMTQAQQHGDVLKEIAAGRQEAAIEAANIRAQAAADRAATTKTNQQQAEQDRQDKMINSGTQAFTHAIQDVSPVVFAAHSVQNMLDRYGNNSIPGVGYDSAFAQLRGNDAVLNRQAVAVVTNALLKAASG